MKTTFNLRTLFIATTVVCVLGACVTYYPTRTVYNVQKSLDLTWIEGEASYSWEKQCLCSEGVSTIRAMSPDKRLVCRQCGEVWRKK